MRMIFVLMIVVVFAWFAGVEMAKAGSCDQTMYDSIYKSIIQNTLKEIELSKEILTEKIAIDIAQCKKQFEDTTGIYNADKYREGPDRGLNARNECINKANSQANDALIDIMAHRNTTIKNLRTLCKGQKSSYETKNY